MHTEPLFEVSLDLPAKGSRRTAATLYEQLKTAILDGRLKGGTKLPSTRLSKEVFGISRNTAQEVYDRLAAEGYVVPRHGSGTFVATVLRKAARGRGDPTQQRLDPRLNSFWLRPETTAAMGFWRDAVPEELPTRSDNASIDFRPALVDSRLFPFDVFRRAFAKELRGLEKRPARLASPQGNQGNYHLRQAISRHIALTRAVSCEDSDIVVTSGAQQAFDLLARLLIKPGETIVAIEDPGYPPMRVAFAAAGAKLLPVNVDAEGLKVDDLPSNVGVICVCPSHQFPLGTTMSARRRKALIAFARRNGAIIIEDDYDGEFRFDGAPLEALRTSDAADVVFYVGTFSKCMLPSLRLGFVVAPEWALPALVSAKNCMDWHCSTPLQIATAAFIKEGHLARHVRNMRALYKERRKRLLSFLRSELGSKLKPIESLYGMHVTALSPKSTDLAPVVNFLARENVRIHDLERYFIGNANVTGLIFGYGAVRADELGRGLSLLRAALVR
jgi:GntR family transcriptional regulator/MocR family aminotransferase